MELGSDGVTMWRDGQSVTLERSDRIQSLAILKVPLTTKLRPLSHNPAVTRHSECSGAKRRIQALVLIIVPQTTRPCKPAANPEPVFRSKNLSTSVGAAAPLEKQSLDSSLALGMTDSCRVFNLKSEVGINDKSLSPPRPGFFTSFRMTGWPGGEVAVASCQYRVISW